MRPPSPPPSPSPSLHSFPSPSLSLSPFLLSFQCTSGWPGWLVFPGIENGLGRGEGSKVGSSSPFINPSTSLNCLATWMMIAILQRCKRRLRRLPPLAQSQAVSKRWGWNQAGSARCRTPAPSGHPPGCPGFRVPAPPCGPIPSFSPAPFHVSTQGICIRGQSMGISDSQGPNSS